MDYIGSDFNSTGSVIPKSELTAARLKRGECVTCGRKCYKKKLFKMIPIDDEEGKILNGRCLQCNPFHNKSTKNSSNHSNSNVRKLQQSKRDHPNGVHVSAVAECTLATSRDIDIFHATQQRRNSLLSPLARALSSPPQMQSANTHHNEIAKTGINHTTRVEQSTGNVSALASMLPLQTPLSENSIASCKSIHSEPIHGSNDCKARAHGHISRTSSHQGSFHSTTSSSIGSMDSNCSSTFTATTRHSHHYYRPPSPQNSMCSKSIGSASNPSSQMERTSREELERAALIIMAAAQEHGLAEAGGVLAASLQDIVNVGVNSTKSGESDATHATTTIVTNDDGEIQDFGGDYEDEYPQFGKESGVLDRGGVFSMRYGRLIYTGSSRTLSSMSSIDEGDRNHPTTHNQSSRLQQPLRPMGKSSRTLGSLSTIDGTNEEEINSLSGDNNKSKNGSRNGTFPGAEGLNPSHPLGSVTTFSSNEKAKTGESLVSTTLRRESISSQNKVNGQHLEETKDHIEIETILQRLKGSVDSSLLVQSMEAMESLSEFLVLLLVDKAPQMDLYTERGLVGVLVAAMRKYPESSEIQVKACEVLTNLLAYDSGHGRSSSIRSQRLQIIMDQEQAGEAILFSSMILHENNPKVQEAALNTMRYLCKDCEENQTNFWKLDAIEPILRAMENHPNEPKVQVTGAAMVSMLANNNQNENAKNTFGENGGIPVIIRAISMHLEDFRVVESCSHALYTLILECPYNILIVLKAPGVTNAILDAMRSHTQSLAVQEIGCATLANLTSQAKHADLLLNNGGPIGIEIANQDDGVQGMSNNVLESVIKTILETIQTHSSVPIIQDLGFAVLANLTDSDETKMFIVDMGALDAIVLAMVLHKDDAGVQERICGLLLLLAVQENHRHILAANPIELVKIAAHKYPEECLEPASQLILQLGLEL